MSEGPLDFNLLLTRDEADVFDSTSLKPRTNKVGSFFGGNIMWHAPVSHVSLGPRCAGCEEQ